MTRRLLGNVATDVFRSFRGSQIHLSRIHRANKTPEMSAELARPISQRARKYENGNDDANSRENCDEIGHRELERAYFRTIHTHRRPCSVQTVRKKKKQQINTSVPLSAITMDIKWKRKARDTISSPRKEYVYLGIGNGNENISG